jgi:hypothetical protein
MGIQRRGSSDSLNRGTLGHHFLEEFYKDRMSGTSYDEAVKNSKTYMMKYLIMNPEQSHYGEEAKKAIYKFFDAGGFKEFEILAVEQEFTAVLDEVTGASILFKVDLIVRDADGKIGVVDNKFVSRLYELKDLDLMSQLVKYYEALNRLGYPVDWVAYSEYKASASQTWVFLPFPITEARNQRTMEEHRIVANKIIELKSGDLFEWSQGATRIQNSMTCKNCSFRELCVAELNDDDPQLVLDRLYKVKEYNNGPGGTPPPQ